MNRKFIGNLSGIYREFIESLSGFFQWIVSGGFLAVVVVVVVVVAGYEPAFVTIKSGAICLVNKQRPLLFFSVSGQRATEFLPKVTRKSSRFFSPSISQVSFRSFVLLGFFFLFFWK